MFAVLSFSFSLQNKRIFFVTNNSSKSRAAYLRKFENFGIEACEVWLMFSVLYLGIVFCLTAEYPAT